MIKHLLKSIFEWTVIIIFAYCLGVAFLYLFIWPRFPQLEREWEQFYQDIATSTPTIRDPDMPSYTFYYQGNTLYWKINGISNPKNYLKLQLDHGNPPAINQEPIKKIEMVNGHRLYILTKDKFWVLNIRSDVGDWYMDDWRFIR